MSLFFFFSSRRRHTRFDCDWSSDVCSSDLLPLLAKQITQNLDANDWIYQLRVNDGFDAYSQLERVKARVLGINMARDEVVPIEPGHIAKASAKLGPKAEYLLVRAAAGYGHATVGQTVDVYAPKLGEFLTNPPADKTYRKRGGVGVPWCRRIGTFGR